MGNSRVIFSMCFVIKVYQLPWNFHFCIKIGLYWPTNYSSANLHPGQDKCGCVCLPKPAWGSLQHDRQLAFHKNPCPCVVEPQQTFESTVDIGYSLTERKEQLVSHFIHYRRRIPLLFWSTQDAVQHLAPPAGAHGEFPSASKEQT